MYLWKFGKIPTTGSQHIVPTRKCNASAINNANTDETRPKNNMPTSVAQMDAPPTGDQDISSCCNLYVSMKPPSPILTHTQAFCKKWSCKKGP